MAPAPRRVRLTARVGWVGRVGFAGRGPLSRVRRSAGPRARWSTGLDWLGRVEFARRLGRGSPGRAAGPGWPTRRARSRHQACSRQAICNSTLDPVRDFRTRSRVGMRWRSSSTCDTKPTTRPMRRGVRRGCSSPRRAFRRPGCRNPRPRRGCRAARRRFRLPPHRPGPVRARATRGTTRRPTAFSLGAPRRSSRPARRGRGRPSCRVHRPRPSARTSSGLGSWFAVARSPRARPLPAEQPGHTSAATSSARSALVH